MKETRFIAQNKEKWQEAETLLDESAKDPEKLSNLFIQVVDDLSYARTYYPNRSVRIYLNKIARQYFSIIYAQKKHKQNQFKLFWLDELPQIILHARRELIIALLIFMLSMSIGIFSAANDPEFVNSILGDDYVTMTEENIERGDPMAVYKQQHEVDMFLGITLNNLMVAFRTYVLGIFLGIGTIGSLLLNGIMVGSFQYYFAARGLFIESATSIWLHGTLEISSIILAGGAGLVLGRGLIFPGTYSRLQSLQINGMRSLKLMLGITPIFVLAAIIESFLTRYTEAPLAIKLLLIASSASYILGYFVIYPLFKLRKGFDVPLKEIRLPASNNEPVNYGRIKTNAEILKNAFQFYSRNSSKILPWAFAVAAGVSGTTMMFEEETFLINESEWWITLFADMLTAVTTSSIPLIFINGLATALIIYRVARLIDAESKATTFSFSPGLFVHTAILFCLLYAAIYTGWFGVICAFLIIGLLIFSSFTLIYEESNIGHGLSRGWELFGMNNTQGASLQVTVLLLSFSSLIVLSAPLLYLHINMLQWNFVASDSMSQKIIHFLELLIKIFSFYLVLPIAVASFSYLYFSQAEAASATQLKESIAKMKMRVPKSSRS